MTDSYRISIETPSGAKFRAAGDASTVREDAERFYALFASTTTPTIKQDANGSPHADDAASNGATNIAEQLALVVGGLDQPTLDRLFSKDKHGTVSLRALPRGEGAESDALVALIYGAGRLANEQQVTGSRLMKAAQQSGLHQVDRIDRSLSVHIGPYVTTAGFKKGRRYGLTNPGIRRAEEILTGILG